MKMTTVSSLDKQHFMIWTVWHVIGVAVLVLTAVVLVLHVASWADETSYESKQESLQTRYENLDTDMDQQLQCISQHASDATRLPQRHSPIEIILEYCDDRDQVRHAIHHALSMQRLEHEARQEKIERWQRHSSVMRDVLWEVLKAGLRAATEAPM
jgi:hypothetical protein